MFSLSLSLKTLIRRTLEVTLHSCLIIERRRELKMMRFMCLVLALSLFSAHGASVGHRMKRESCSVMMIRTSNCSNHGYCGSDNIGPHCVCYEGWGGHLCQYVVNGRPQAGESSPLIDDGGDIGGDNDGDDDGDVSTPDQPAAQVTEETREPEVTVTQGISEQTTDAQDEVMRTERPHSTRDATGEEGMSEHERLAMLCNDLYARTNTCTTRHGHCSIDAIGAFCQCNTGFIGTDCQYKAENVAGVLEAILGMIRDPHYRVIGGAGDGSVGGFFF